MHFKPWRIFKTEKDELTNITQTDKSIGFITGPNQPFTDGRSTAAQYNTVFLLRDIV